MRPSAWLLTSAARVQARAVTGGVLERLVPPREGLPLFPARMRQVADPSIALLMVESGTPRTHR
jgi:hypothetical protein